MTGLRDLRDDKLRKLADFVEQDPQPAFEADRSGKILYVNPAASARFPDLTAKGAAHGLLVDWPKILIELDREPSQSVVRIVSVGEKYFEEWLSLSQNRSSVRVRAADVTRREQSISIVRRFESVMNRMPELVTLIDKDYVYLAANDAYCNAHKLKREALVGKTVSQVWGEQVFRSVIKGHLDRCLAGAEVSYQLWIDFPALGRRQIAATFMPLVDGQGGTQAVVVSRDVTQVFEIEEKVRSRERREAQARMAEGLVKSIGKQASAIKEKLSGPKDSSKSMIALSLLDPALASHAELQPAAERIADVIEGLKIFYEKPQSSISSCSIAKVLEAAVAQAGAVKPHGVQIRVEPSTLPSIECDPKRLQTVVNLLVVTSIQAIHASKSREGKITVEAWNEGGADKISVSDTGPSIPDHFRESIFEPFFEGVPERSSFRLAVARKIAEDLGGRLEFVSTSGPGAQFVVTLPLKADRNASLAATPTHPVRTRAHVIVIDDDPAVCSLVRNALHDEHEVTAFTGGRDAVKFLEKIPPVDIVFLDLMMPGMSGIEVFSELESKLPDFTKRVVFLTGGLTTPQAEKFLLSLNNRTCGKPLNPTALVNLVREIVAGK